MRSRLGFAICTAVDPDILILDEVLSVGDARFRKKSEKKVMDMFEKGVTVLFVSHSLAQVKRICNKAIILDHGKMLAYGDIDDVAAQYQEFIKDKDPAKKKRKKKRKKAPTASAGAEGVSNGSNGNERVIQNEIVSKTASPDGR